MWRWIDIIIRYEFLVAYLLEENGRLRKLVPLELQYGEEMMRGLASGEGVSAIARRLNVSRTTIYKFAKRHGYHVGAPAIERV